MLLWSFGSPTLQLSYMTGVPGDERNNVMRHTFSYIIIIRMNLSFHAFLC